jgi:hypothetical protein
VVMAWPETLRDESLPANFVGFPEWVFPIWEKKENYIFFFYTIKCKSP